MGWWCPRHPWPPAWARGPFCGSHPYVVGPSDELKALEDMKREIEAQLADITKRIEELRSSVEGK